MRSIWLHLRFPFSFFLLPVFLFALAISPNISGERIFWVFIILHFLVYPASNGYNSYFDRDEKSIGTLKNPPPVNKGLYITSLIMDGLAIVLSLVFLHWHFAVMVFIYGAISKAYSHPAIRLKKYPVPGWLIVGIFQGFFTFLMSYVGLNDFPIQLLDKVHILIPASLTTLLLLGSYPITQVYQHSEDKKRGDITISIKLGVRGTFHLTAALFMLALIGFFVYFKIYFEIKYAIGFALILFPTLIYFIQWYLKVRKDPEKATFSGTMWLNAISALCLNVFFIYFFLDYSQVLQAIKAGY